MKRKIILTTTLLSVVALIVFVAFGVYAAMTQHFGIDNIIKFEPERGIYLSFSGEISNCTQSDYEGWKGTYETKDEYLYARSLKYLQEFNERDRGNPNLPSSYEWGIRESLGFVDGRTPITYKIVIKNYSETPVDINLNFKENGLKILNNVSVDIYDNAKISSGDKVTIDSYNGTQKIKLQKYVLNQAQEPARCEFTIKTSMKSSELKQFTEENNFTFTAHQVM